MRPTLATLMQPKLRNKRSLSYFLILINFLVLLSTYLHQKSPLRLERTKAPQMNIQPELYRDHDIAHLLGMSRSWVRVQRHKRRYGQEHVFDISPCYIGASPRYRRSDVEDFLSRVS